MITAEQKKHLIQKALEARTRAYAPYSEYPVGAALLTTSGKLFEGVNVESAAYPTGICAERSAVFHAVSRGERAFSAIAVVSQNGGSPCGACRQVLAEFGQDILVLIGDETGAILSEFTIAELLPEAFGPMDLVKGTNS